MRASLLLSPNQRFDVGLWFELMKGANQAGLLGHSLESLTVDERGMVTMTMRDSTSEDLDEAKSILEAMEPK